MPVDSDAVPRQASLLHSGPENSFNTHQRERERDQERVSLTTTSEMMRPTISHHSKSLHIIAPSNAMQIFFDAYENKMATTQSDNIKSDEMINIF